MKKISAEIVADSVNEHGNRITTMLLTYPRFIHGELLTHRLFSRNSASSRAIPFHKMVEMVEEGPFIPIAWQKDHKGMQGNEYVDELEASILATDWLVAANNAINHAKKLHNGTELSTGRILSGTTKQLCNRLLEPFMWHTALITATEFENFFELRCPKYYAMGRYYKSKRDLLKEVSFQEEPNWYELNISQAEIHIQALAEVMWDAQNESNPKQLKSGDWHIPFGDRIDNDGGKFVKYLDSIWRNKQAPTNGNTKERIKIAVARAARLSYMTFDGEIDYEKDIKLHDQLLESRHMSPFEHCAKAMGRDYDTFIKGELTLEKITQNFQHYKMDRENKHNTGWCNNFRGWVQYRYMIENNIQL